MQDIKMEAIDIVVTQRLRQRRIELGHTQKDLAKICKVTVTQYSKYENHGNRISNHKLYNCALFLQTPISYFFDCSEETIIYNHDTEKLLYAYHKLKNFELKLQVKKFIECIS